MHAVCIPLTGRPAFHRDVKSANIVLTADLRPKLIDCGLAKYVPEHANAGSIMPSLMDHRGIIGTQAYLCPAYVSGKARPFEARCEVFSFGLVMAEVLTGKIQGSHGVDHGQDGVEYHDADVRAGAWPRECVDKLCELITGCCQVIIKRRIPDIATVLRQLRALRDQFCPVSELAVQRMIAKYDQLEQTALVAEHRDRDRRLLEEVRLQQRMYLCEW